MPRQISTITGIAVLIAVAAIVSLGVFAYQYFSNLQSANSYVTPQSQAPVTNVQSNQNIQSSNTQTVQCSNLYWFDNLNGCSQTPKQFCGSYMYYGLHTFNSEQECLNGWSVSSGRGPAN